MLMMNASPAFQRLMGASLLVFANKSDVEGGMSAEDIRLVRRPTMLAHDDRRRRGLMTHRTQGLQLDAIRTHRWVVMGCSAITGDHLDAGLAWVVDDAKQRLFLY